VNNIQSPSKKTRVVRGAHPTKYCGTIKATSRDELARSRLASGRILPPGTERAKEGRPGKAPTKVRDWRQRGTAVVAKLSELICWIKLPNPTENTANKSMRVAPLPEADSRLVSE
jgi:hypothetical protein